MGPRAALDPAYIDLPIIRREQSGLLITFRQHSKHTRLKKKQCDSEASLLPIDDTLQNVFPYFSNTANV